MYNNGIVNRLTYLLTFLLATVQTITPMMAVQANAPIIPVKVAVPSFSQLNDLTDFIRDDHHQGAPTFPFLNAQGAVMTNSTGQTSSLFTKTQMAKANPTSPGFSTYFVMDIYKTNSGVPADGYVFTLANNTSTLGSTGGGLGYAGVPESVGIIFDYYQNNGLEIVASTDVFTNGALSSRTGSGFDGTFLTRWSNTPLNQKVRSMHTWIEFNASTSTIDIRVSPDNATRPTSATRTQTNLTLTQISEFYYAGFSAATGGSSMSTVLNQWYFASEFIQGGIDLTTAQYGVDNTPPTSPDISTTLEDDQYTLHVSGGTDDNGISSYQVKKPNGNWITYTAPILMDAMGVYEARTVDTVGNFSTTVSSIGLWTIDFVGQFHVLKSVKVLSTDVYTINEILSDHTYRYTEWLYQNQPIEEVAYPSQSIQLTGVGNRYVFSIEYHLNGGTPETTLPQLYTLGESWTQPSLYLEGHTFEGWFMDEALQFPFDEGQINVQESSFSLFAKFSPIQLSLYLYVNPNSDPWVEINTTYGSLIAPLIAEHIPTKVGYTFQGWTTDEAGLIAWDSASTLTSMTHLYAQWTINVHTVTFLDEQGQIIQSLSVDYAALIPQFPVVVRPGYAWIGWAYQNQLIDPTHFKMPDRAITLTPVFEGLRVELIFITNEGTFSIEAVSGEAIGDLPVLTMLHDYDFVGWSLTPLDENQLIDATYIVPNVETLTLFPIWQARFVSPQTNPLQPNASSPLEQPSYAGWLMFVSMAGLVVFYVWKVIREEMVHGK